MTCVIFLGAILALVGYLTVTHTDEIPIEDADELNYVTTLQG